MAENADSVAGGAIPFVLAAASSIALVGTTAQVCRNWQNAATDESVFQELALSWIPPRQAQLLASYAPSASHQRWRWVCQRLSGFERSWRSGATNVREVSRIELPKSILHLATSNGILDPGIVKTSATACFDGKVRIYAWRGAHRDFGESQHAQSSLRHLSELTHGIGPVDACHICSQGSSDSVLVASGSRDSSVKLWLVSTHDSTSARECELKSTPHMVWNACGGRVMSVATDGNICVAGMQYSPSSIRQPRSASVGLRSAAGDLDNSTQHMSRPFQIWSVDTQIELHRGIALPPRAQCRSVACAELIPGGQGQLATANIGGWVHRFEDRKSVV